MSIRLIPVAAASIPTPPAGKYWLFLNASNADAPSLKDDAGAVTLIAGALADGDYGDVTVSGGGTVIAIDAGVVTNAKLADVSTATFKGRTTAGTGSPEDLTVAQAKTLLNLSGTNSGDQTITLTGDVTGSGTGSFAATIANDAVTYAKIQNISTTQRVLGRNTAGAGDTEEVTFAQFMEWIGTASNDDIVQRKAGAFTNRTMAQLAADLSATNTWQPLDSDLTTIAGLTATTDNFMVSVSSAWASRTPAQAAATLQKDGLTVDAVGFRGIPQNSQSAAYTTVAADAGKHIHHPSTDANARTFTIDSNANVPYPIGTAITFTNRTSQVVTIAITSDTMYLAGTTTTGSRSLAENGIATALKVNTTTWIISGTGIS